MASAKWHNGKNTVAATSAFHFCVFQWLNQFNIIDSLDVSQHENADLFYDRGEQITGHTFHSCNVMLTFNSAKPTINHSGLIFASVCAVKNKNVTDPRAKEMQ